MLKNLRDPREAREAMLSLMPTAATLAGICVGLMSIANARIARGVDSMADDLFLFAGLGFLAVCYLIFFAMRIEEPRQLPRWSNAIDIVFMGSLTLVVFSGFIVLYEFL